MRQRKQARMPPAAPRDATSPGIGGPAASPQPHGEGVLSTPARRRFRRLSFSHHPLIMADTDAILCPLRPSRASRAVETVCGGRHRIPHTSPSANIWGRSRGFRRPRSRLSRACRAGSRNCPLAKEASHPFGVMRQVGKFEAHGKVEATVRAHLHGASAAVGQNQLRDDRDETAAATDTRVDEQGQ